MADSLTYFSGARSYFIFKNDFENIVFRNHVNKDSTSLLKPAEGYYTSCKTAKEYTLKPIQINRENTDWISIILLSTFILITLSKAIFQRKFNLIWKSIYNIRNFNALLKEINIFNEFQSLLLFIVYLLNFSLFLYFIIRYFMYKTLFGFNFNEYLALAGLFTAFLLAKFIIIRIIGVIFKTSGKALEYLISKIIFNLVLGIFLLPVLIFIFYTGNIPMIYIGLIIITLYYLYSLSRDFFIGVSVIKFSKVYLFIYLCTLEILPVMLLIKFFLID